MDICSLSVENMIPGIRHIIFDLGGVLLNLDYSATERAFAELGITNFGALFSQLKQTPLFDDLETGRCSAADFVAALQRAAPELRLTEEQIISAWNAMLLDFPLRRLQLLQQLRLHYDLFLLSNTNEIHEAAFNEILFRTCGYGSIAHFFDKAYLSHRLGMRKPDTEVFLHILEENELKPEHTLFIDDSPQHIDAARSLGIQTIYLGPGMTIEDNIFLRK
jgi:putative hydrolase of the HAD superfamily